MRILLTGGTGFLGQRLASGLMAAGHQVRALVRLDSPRRAAMAPGVESAPGDVTDPASLERAVAGCDSVVHSAALVKMWVRDRSAFDRVNVEGLNNVVEASRRAGVGRVLYTSSFIALGPTDGVVADESHARRSPGFHNDYERTKAVADRLARDWAGRGAPLVTVYPGVVYGPGELTDGGLMTKTIRDFMRRRVPYLGTGRQRICYAFIDDVVRGHLLALDRGRPGGRYILGGSNASYRELFEILERLTGVPAPRLHVPFWVMGSVGRLLRWRAELFGIEPMITDQVVGVYRHDWAYSSDLAVRDLGYEMTPLEEGLRRTVAWLRSLPS
ncbi:MAG TPA: NAD-dependent epimerase/dehydratase family protein [Candidatus Polarisedimenticolia bacterium]|nr:NAD-dependent epimerase/dehydratase family protein [Candidatus Polarisedimenticolia bacterium]